MDDLATPLMRVDGSGLAVALTLGARARIHVDEGDPPILVIDAGPWMVTIEALEGDARTASVLADLAVAAERLRASVAARVVTAGQDGWP